MTETWPEPPPLEDPALAALGRSWTDAAAAYASFVEETERRVVRWGWGPGFASWERLEPFWNEQHGRRRSPVRLRKEPADKSSGELFGFDAAGDVLVSRRFRYDGSLEWETLRLATGVCLMARSDGGDDARLEHIQVPAYMDGRLQRLDWFRLASGDSGVSWTGTLYAYEGDRLVAMRSAGREPGQDVMRFPALRLTYADDGALLTIASDAGGVRYRRAATGEVARASRLIREEYPERIAAWAQRIAPAQELACLIIRYPYVSHEPLPPSLALGTARELQARRLARHQWPLLHLFDAVEYEHIDFAPAELDTPELRHAHQLLHQQWSSTDDLRQPRALLVDIAKRLAARSWTHLPIAPEGLAIFAVDGEFADLERNLKASVPAPLRRTITNLSRDAR
ncbi:MAG TPA: hypothetical protein VI300_20900 [Solirubrobacter sp.]